MNWYKRALSGQPQLDIDYALQLQQAEASIKAMERDKVWYQGEIQRKQKELTDLRAVTPPPPDLANREKDLNDQVSMLNQRVTEIDQSIAEERQGLQLMNASQANNAQRQKMQPRPQQDVRMQNMFNPQMWSNPFAAMQARMQQNSQY